ncbi:tetratricopeptide repeat protein [Nocardia pseudovaccinii]|uniref:tetratricopeptide repeat protein n=1 Tax=Nocardia pseudovaccinii TaxID=189540 RepID=UPI003D8E911E
MERAGGDSRARAGPGSTADERRQLRESLAELGLAEQDVLDRLVGELRQRGYRLRAAWRLAKGLSQTAAAARYNELTDSARAAMKASRISEYETWPSYGHGDDERRKPLGVRPTIQVLTNLATIYGTTWDQLVDVADLTHMPESDRQQYRDAVARHSIGRQPLPASGDLPAEVRHFTGRHDQKAELRRLVYEHLGSGNVAVHVIDGLTGIGKTALARYAVSALAKNYPDGFIWFDLHGYSSGREPRQPFDVLEQLLLEIGEPRETIKADPGGRANQWRSAMMSRRMLVVFDNVLDTAQVKDLLPGAPGCFVLITSRRKLTGLAATPLHLDELGSDDAEELLVKLGNLRSGYDQAAVTTILRTAGRLPLAIRLIGGQIAHHGEEMLSEIAADLVNLTARIEEGSTEHPAGDSAAAHLLDRFAAEDESLRTAFEVSYQRLRDDPQLQRAVRLLGWFPGPEISAEAMATMAAVPLGDAMMMVRRLFEAGFLDPASGGPGPRYQMHDLTRLCARIQADREDPPSEHAAVIERLVRDGLDRARKVYAPALFDGPSRSKDSATTDTAEARMWLTTEREMLKGCVDASRPTADAAELARLVASLLCELGHWSDAHRLYGRALDIARILDAPEAEAAALHGLGHVERMACDYRVASNRSRQALAIAIDIGDLARVGSVRWGYAETIRRIGRYAAARRNYAAVLEIARATKHRKMEGDALRGLGYIERSRERHDIAGSYFDTALDIAREVHDRYGEGWALWGLGNIARKAGDYTAARARFHQARAIAAEINDPRCQIDALRGLGHIERRLARYDSARHAYDDSLTIARQIRDPHGEADALRALGYIAADTGDTDRAQRLWARALELYDQIGVRRTPRRRRPPRGHSTRV